MKNFQFFPVLDRKSADTKSGDFAYSPHDVADKNAGQPFRLGEFSYSPHKVADTKSGDFA